MTKILITIMVFTACHSSKSKTNSVILPLQTSNIGTSDTSENIVSKSIVSQIKTTDTIKKLEPILTNIEEKINAAILVAFGKGEILPINDIEKKLKEELKVNVKNKFARYWLSYTLYYISIYNNAKEKPEFAETKIQEALTNLESDASLTTEDNALLSMMRSYSVSFLPIYKISSVSSKAEAEGIKSIELNKNNLRAYLALGIRDFYTPTAFGGGKKCEELLEKALNCPDKLATNPYYPSWGRDLVYQYLIEFFIKNERNNDAKSLLKGAREKLGNNEFGKKYNLD